MSVDAIRTERLLLVPCDASLARAEADHRDAFFRQLGVDRPEVWPPENNDQNTIAFNLQKLTQGGDRAVGWWQWYFILEEAERRQLIGNGGFKGPPDADGLVEVGYALLDAFRGNSYAAEALTGLTDWAARHGARQAIVQTLPELQASIRTAQKAGFDGPMKGLEPGAVMLVRDLVPDAAEPEADAEDEADGGDASSGRR